MSKGFNPSIKHHIKQCKLAGCLHPAVYFNKVLGWCKKCRDFANKEENEQKNF